MLLTYLNFGKFGRKINIQNQDRRPIICSINTVDVTDKEPHDTYFIFKRGFSKCFANVAMWYNSVCDS